MNKRLIASFAALVALVAAAPGTASAQLSKDGQKCVTTLHKDGTKVASSYAKQLATCLSDAHKGDVVDLPACVAADLDENTVKAVTKGGDDASKRCTEVPPAFGIPLSFDDTISEAAEVHTAGLFADLLGDTPAVAGTDDGNACQASALKEAQGLASSYAKAFNKCVKTVLKDGADESDALATCLSPDLTKEMEKLSSNITKQCEGVSPAVALPGDCSGETDASVAACIATRTRCRACREAATFAAVEGTDECELFDDGALNDSCEFPVTLSGNAIVFNGSDDRVEGASVWILEHPDRSVITDVEGYFEFPDLGEGEEITLVLEHPDYHPIQNGTVRLGATGASLVTFQAVPWATFDALAGLLGIVPDDVNACQMVTTVTRVGKSLYDPGAHGEVGAKVKIDPPVTSDHGPIYFNSSVLPQRGLPNTSDDGGVLYVQMPLGEYLWSAHKGAAVFTRIKSTCRAGLLVNASPPWGLQKH